MEHTTARTSMVGDHGDISAQIIEAGLSLGHNWGVEKAVTLTNDPRETLIHCKLPVAIIKHNGTVYRYGDNHAVFSVRSVRNDLCRVCVAIYSLHHQHPHTGGGALCPGGWASEIANAMAVGNWKIALLLCSASLTQYNQSSPVISLSTTVFCEVCGAAKISNCCPICDVYTSLRVAINQEGSNVEVRVE